MTPKQSESWTYRDTSVGLLGTRLLLGGARKTLSNTTFLFVIDVGKGLITIM